MLPFDNFRAREQERARKQEQEKKGPENPCLCTIQKSQIQK
jgi:hypothetical protein